MNISIRPHSTVVGKLLKVALLVAAWWCAGFCQAASAQQATARDYEGTYGGTYRANQGLTRMVIVIEALSDTEVGARYVFYPDNANHSVPSGEYLLQGTVDGKTGRLVLIGKRWIEQPRNYVMLDMAGTLSTDRKTFAGQVYMHEDSNTKFDFKAARWSREQ